MPDSRPRKTNNCRVYARTLIAVAFVGHLSRRPRELGTSPPRTHSSTYAFSAFYRKSAKTVRATDNCYHEPLALRFSDDNHSNPVLVRGQESLVKVRSVQPQRSHANTFTGSIFFVGFSNEPPIPTHF
jgi:hypothetical protein